MGIFGRKRRILGLFHSLAGPMKEAGQVVSWGGGVKTFLRRRTSSFRELGTVGSWAAGEDVKLQVRNTTGRLGREAGESPKRGNRATHQLACGGGKGGFVG